MVRYNRVSERIVPHTVGSVLPWFLLFCDGRGSVWCASLGKRIIQWCSSLIKQREGVKLKGYNYAIHSSCRHRTTFPDWP